jgi:dCMP deaminase
MTSVLSPVTAAFVESDSPDGELARDLLREAYLFARQHSDDLHTNNGALILSRGGSILALGANHFPEGVFVTAERQERANKKPFMEHAERDVIYACSRKGVATEGSTMYCPWAACTDCARAIIEAGIHRVVVHKQMMDKTPDRWKAEIEIANVMLDEAGILVDIYDGEIGGVEVLFDCELWQP